MWPECSHGASVDVPVSHEFFIHRIGIGSARDAIRSIITGGMQFRRHEFMRCFFLIPLLAPFFVGCGSKPAAPLAVEGTVTFMGRPLSGGMIVLTPDRDRGMYGKPIIAEIIHDGSYRLPEAGVQPGWYRVSISDASSWNAVEGFPASLRRPDRSGLNRELVAGRGHRLDFHIDVPHP